MSNLQPNAGYGERFEQEETRGRLRPESSPLTCNLAANRLTQRVLSSKLANRDLQGALQVRLGLIRSAQSLVHLTQVVQGCNQVMRILLILGRNGLEQLASGCPRRDRDCPA